MTKRTPKRLQRLMSMREVGELMFPEVSAKNPDSAARRARRYLRRQDPKAKWFKRHGKTSPYKVTMAQLRKHCPELFSGRDRLVMLMLPHINEIKDAQQELGRTQVLLCQELVSVKNRITKLEKC